MFFMKNRRTFSYNRIDPPLRPQNLLLTDCADLLPTIDSLKCIQEVPQIGASVHDVRVPGPEKGPKIMAQYSEVESIGSIGSVILANLEVRVLLLARKQLLSCL